MASEVRLYVEHPLAQGQGVPLSQAQAHYLFGVMRLGPGAPVTVFNGRDGAWRAEVHEARKRAGTLVAQAQTAPQGTPPDLWLLFAPLKKARTDFVVEKAVELGVRQLVPVSTEFTNADRLRQDRAQAHAIEAAEQCGATFVPEVAALTPLPRVLADWPDGRRLAFCDEAAAGAPAGFNSAPGTAPGPWAILIGPEGGFSEAERTRLRGLAGVQTLSLGPRILRAETAALAALTLWQSSLGDWR